MSAKFFLVRQRAAATAEAIALQIKAPLQVDHRLRERAHLTTEHPATNDSVG